MTDFQDRLRRIEGVKGAHEAARLADPALLRLKRDALKKRRKAAATKLAYIIMTPLLIMFFVFWREPTMAWLYANGILPDYGVMQFMDGRTMVDWDRTLVAAAAGAASGLVGYLIATPVVRIFMR